MSDGELSDWLDAAVEAARLGAAELDSWRHRFQVREKGRADLVTEADLASQRVIRSYLAHRFPSHGFVGEEDGPKPTPPGPGAPPTWDVAGGIALIREAGGVVTGADGRPVDAFAPDVLASNGPLHPALLDCLREGPG